MNMNQQREQEQKKIQTKINCACAIFRSMDACVSVWVCSVQYVYLYREYIWQQWMSGVQVCVCASASKTSI